MCACGGEQADVGYSIYIFIHVCVCIYMYMHVIYFHVVAFDVVGGNLHLSI